MEKSERCMRAEDNSLGYAPVIGLIGRFAVPSVVGLLG